MQQGLSLFAAAGELAGFAVLLDLGEVTLHGFPTFDLALVFLGSSAAEIVAAVPLEPAARVLGMDPAFLLPVLQGHGGLDAEEVGFLHVREPLLGEFVRLVRYVGSVEDAEFQHFFGSEVRFEFGVEVFAGGALQKVEAFLEGIVDSDLLGHERSLLLFNAGPPPRNVNNEKYSQFWSRDLRALRLS